MGEEAHFTVSHSIFTARPRDAILQERSFKGVPLRELLRARKANSDGLRRRAVRIFPAFRRARQFASSMKMLPTKRARDSDDEREQVEKETNENLLVSPSFFPTFSRFFLPFHVFSCAILTAPDFSFIRSCIYTVPAI